jgi:hypothetical protein
MGGEQAAHHADAGLKDRDVAVLVEVEVGLQAEDRGVEFRVVANKEQRVERIHQRQRQRAPCVLAAAGQRAQLVARQGVAQVGVVAVVEH